MVVVVDVESMCMVVSAPDVVVELVVLVVVDSSAFLPQPNTASATVRARSATIAIAKFFRMSFPSPPLEDARTGIARARRSESMKCPEKAPHRSVSGRPSFLLGRVRLDQKPHACARGWNA